MQSPLMPPPSPPPVFVPLRVPPLFIPPLPLGPTIVCLLCSRAGHAVPSFFPHLPLPRRLLGLSRPNMSAVADLPFSLSPGHARSDPRHPPFPVRSIARLTFLSTHLVEEQKTGGNPHSRPRTGKKVLVPRVGISRRRNAPLCPSTIVPSLPSEVRIFCFFVVRPFSFSLTRTDLHLPVTVSEDEKHHVRFPNTFS